MNASEVNKKWVILQHEIAQSFDMDLPDLKVFLFLIGVQELGKGPQTFSKREKEELMHIANCRLFSAMGFYELKGLDEQGWPHWELVKPIPNYTHRLFPRAKCHLIDYNEKDYFKCIFLCFIDRTICSEACL